MQTPVRHAVLCSIWTWKKLIKMSVYKGFVWFNTNTIAFKKTQKNNNNYSGIKKRLATVT